MLEFLPFAVGGGSLFWHPETGRHWLGPDLVLCGTEPGVRKVGIQPSNFDRSAKTYVGS